MSLPQVVTWPVERLIPYARNARTHSDEQVAQIAASIAEFGWTNPILAGPDGIIIAGHARLLAARKLGKTEVPVIVIDHLTETQRRALVLADNRLALNAGWDEEMLRVELEAIREDDYDLGVIGFSDDELADLLADPEQVQAAGNTDDDAVPEEQENAVTAVGDIWLLRDHRLLCGDSTQMDAVEKVLAGGLADMVFTDPPYNVNYGATMKDKLRGNKRKIANDNLGDDFERFLYDACVNILAVTKGAVYVCMSSSELHTLEKAFREAGGHWSTFVIWAKNTFTMGRSDYQRQYEPILYGWKEGTDHYWCGARDQGDVWFVKKPVANDLHPTMKPVELVERAIRNSSKGRDTVLDPFGGSGTTLIACEKAGRSARLIELEPKYCDVIVRRWQEFTGREATLDGDGRTFAEVAGDGVAA
ncbi:MAG TPA: site-specific DNA-methyltransferase [Hyphomonadaceae bacterium]|jgi:DNA modification methylase|nr:site-specific DNA-methyltransferase [Hyphomonadaceae bacterium]